MALTISYVDGSDDSTQQCYGVFIATAVVTLGSSSADCGVVPSSAKIARIKAGEACIVSNSGVAASATVGVPLDAGEVIDLQVPVEGQFKAKTA